MYHNPSWFLQSPMSAEWVSIPTSPMRHHLLHFPRLPETVKATHMMSLPFLKNRFIFIKTSTRISQDTLQIYTQRFKKIQHASLSTPPPPLPPHTFLFDRGHSSTLCLSVQQCVCQLLQEAPQSSFLWFVALSDAAFNVTRERRKLRASTSSSVFH